jgi:hypothetical protein
MAEERTAEQNIGALAEGDVPVLETTDQMTVNTLSYQLRAR